MPDVLSPPVVLVVYNRPQTIAQVMAAVRAARPSSLFVVADGPRRDVPGDDARTRACRELTETIDWPCQVVRDYAPVNLGIRARMETGLALAFAHVEAAIVLEDDCVPASSFFTFCAGLLDRYRDDTRVMGIGGSRLTPSRPGRVDTYAFSRYPLIWGWATWRRAWQHYDGAMRAWPSLRDGGWLDTALESPVAVRYWSHVLEQNHRDPDARNWDAAWLLTCWRLGGLSVVPAANLVSNVGFGPDSSHTRDARSPLSRLPVHTLAEPWRHPSIVARDPEEDAVIESVVFSGNLDRALTTLRARMQARRSRTIAEVM